MELNNLGDILTLTKKLCKISTTVTSFDDILLSGINEAYDKIQELEPAVSSAKVRVIRDILTLPDDLRKIISFDPELDPEHTQVGKNLIFNGTETTQYTLKYVMQLDKLQDNEDIPEVSQKYWSALASYGAYKYYLFKKNQNMAINFYNDYSSIVEGVKSIGKTRKSVKNTLTKLYYGGVR